MQIVILPRFIWAYKPVAIISDVVMHFEPCQGLIRPYIFLFNSLMIFLIQDEDAFELEKSPLGLYGRIGISTYIHT